MIHNDYILTEQSGKLSGEVSLHGGKNAVLVIMASLLLTKGKSILKNVPNSADVSQMIMLLKTLGAKVFFDSKSNYLEIDTSQVNNFDVSSEIMGKMRASILVVGPLLARFKKAKVSLPGGCVIGARPIDLHLKGFKKMGVEIEEHGDFLNVFIVSKKHEKNRIVLDFPSVGATENIAMLAALMDCETTIINAALEPEVFDFLSVLKKMGVSISAIAPATLKIIGKPSLKPIQHSIISDRLEAGALLLAAAMSGGDINLPQARVCDMDIFLSKLEEMGHQILVGEGDIGVRLISCPSPKAVNFKTGVYPGFPSDLQAPMMAAQCIADGTSEIEETVFENRLMHVNELQKMGAQISVSGSRAIVRGVETSYGANVIASDIRASCALVLAGLVAQGASKIFGLHHWRRGYDCLEKKLTKLGAKVSVLDGKVISIPLEKKLQKSKLIS